MSPPHHLRLVREGEPGEPSEGRRHPEPGEGPGQAGDNPTPHRRRGPQPGLGSSPVARVSITPRAARELDELPLTIRGRVLAVFERLERWPEVSGARPLRGELAGLHRVRTGDYRVLFRVRGSEVIVERVGHRERFYED